MAAHTAGRNVAEPANALPEIQQSRLPPVGNRGRFLSDSQLGGVSGSVITITDVGPLEAKGNLVQVIGNTGKCDAVECGRNAARSRQKENASHCGLLIYAAGEEAAVDSEDLAGHETGRLGGEEDGGAGEFLDLAEAAHGRAQAEFLAARGSFEE